MILKIELENFFSIRDRIRIDFRAANINTALARELSHNVIHWKDLAVLKTVGLFGPNASGKSNIVKALVFCLRTILYSHTHNEGTTFDFQPFKFDGWQERPSGFLIDFVCDDIEYEYAFTLSRQRILSESLYYYPVGRRAKIFTRDSDDNYTFGTAVIVKPSDVVTNTGRKTLFLSRASSMNREIAQKLYRYFLHHFEAQTNIAKPDGEQLTIDFFNKYKPLILKALEICDTNITDIEVRREQAVFPSFTVVGNEVQIENVDLLRFKTFHRHRHDVLFDLNLEESAGTRKLFHSLLLLLDVVHNRKSVIMDEFDTGFHTRLADFILDLIHAADASQLLFTSHNTNLIDVKRLRRDQILFVNKSPEGTTEVYSLYDFKDFRENMDAEKGYLQGRFDAVPYVDSSVSCLRQLLNP